jgi:transcriptional/translational regulatory protein YebC/TACO1
MELAPRRVDDFQAEPEGYEVLVEPARFEGVHRAIEGAGIKCASAQVSQLPMVSVPLSDPSVADAVNRLIEAIEEHDDVKEVFSNAEFTA